MVPDGLALPMRAACGLLCRAMVFTPENRPTVLTALQWFEQRVSRRRTGYSPIEASRLQHLGHDPVKHADRAASGRAGAIVV
jgi:hypothetical protein